MNIIDLIARIAITHHLRSDTKYIHHQDVYMNVYVRITYKGLTDTFASAYRSMITKETFRDYSYTKEGLEFLSKERNEYRSMIANYMLQGHKNFNPKKFGIYVHNLKAFNNRDSLLSNLDNAQKITTGLIFNNRQAITSQPVESWDAETIRAQITVLQQILIDVKKELPISVVN